MTAVAGTRLERWRKSELVAELEALQRRLHELGAGAAVPGPREQPDLGVRELETLTELARALTISLEPEVVTREVLSWAQRLIPGAAGRLWTFSEDGELRVLAGSVGVKSSGDDRVLRAREGLASLAIETGEPVISEDLTRDPRYMKRGWARREGLVSAIFLPLIHKDRAYGHLAIFTRERHRFAPREVEVLQSFAAQAATAIANSALYRERALQRERLRALNRMSAGLVDSLELEQTLDRVVEQAATLLGVEGAGLRLLQGEHLVVATTYGLAKGTMLEPSLRIGESLAGVIASQRAPIVIDDVGASGDMLERHRSASEHRGIRCYLGVPVIYGERLIGVLVAVGVRRRKFRTGDVELLSAFAGYAAIAIENSRLYRAAEQELEERERVEEELRRHRDRLEELVHERTAALREAQAQLLRRQRLATIGELTGSVSHELRTPLGTIRASLDVVRQSLASDPATAGRALERALRNVTRCDGIISDLMDFTRLPAARRRRLAMAPWLGALLEEQELGEDVVLRRELAAELAVEIDEERFRRAVINVLQNAEQAMAEAQGSRPSVLTVRCRAEGPRAVVDIEDTGPGMSEEVRASIFEPLYSTKGFGLGLGLPIVSEIMEQHGGGVEVSSEPGRGTRVRLWIPLFAPPQGEGH